MSLNEYRLRGILQFNPDYMNYEASDLAVIEESMLGTIMLGFILNPEDSEILIPQPFKDQYGEYAAAEYVSALQKEAVRRGQPEIYAQSILALQLDAAANTVGINAYDSGIDVYEGAGASTTAQLADGTTVATTAPNILNFVIAHNAAAAGNTEQLAVTLPRSVVTAMIDQANLPEELKQRNHQLGLSDNALYMAGYAASAGLSSEIGALTMDYSPQAAACQIADLTKQIYTDGAPALQPYLAWATGYIRQDMDEMSPEELSTLLAPCPSPSSETAERARE